MKHTSLAAKLVIASFLFIAVSLFPLPKFMNTMCATTIKAATATLQDSDDTKVKLNVNSKSLILEDTYTLKVYRTTSDEKVSFKSSDSSVASVKKTEDKEAVITAKDTGDTIITVTVKDGSKTVATLKCEVTVTPPAVSVKLIADGKDSTIKLEVDEKVYVKRELKPATTCEKPTFSSSNTKVATVSSSGVITAVSPGTCRIFATIESGQYDWCTVKVTK